MRQKAYKIVELEELLAARSAAEVAEDEAGAAKKAPSEAESVTVARFEDAVATTAIPKAPVAPKPEHGGNGDDMPESLRGLSALDLSVLETDSMLTPAEQAWFRKRKGRPVDFSSFGPNAWMAF